MGELEKITHRTDAIQAATKLMDEFVEYADTKGMEYSLAQFNKWLGLELADLKKRLKVEKKRHANSGTTKK